MLMSRLLLGAKHNPCSKIEVEGDLPSPRRGAVGWSYEGNLFFGFGIKEKDDQEDFCFVQGGDVEVHDRKKALFFTNQIVKFDLKQKSFSDFPTTGLRPRPTSHPGVTTSKSKVFVY